jgi:uncharacterized BrkB/YihY/UPF0761 family membrane protein
LTIFKMYFLMSLAPFVLFMLSLLGLYSVASIMEGVKARVEKKKES